MIIPWQELNSDTLDNLVREYIIGKLEDYQMEDTDFDKWSSEIKGKLLRGEALIEWSEEHETVTLVDADKYR